MRRLFIVVTFISAFVIYSCGPTEQKEPEQKTEPAKPVQVESGGVQIAYTSCGEKDTTLLFVHGWCINKEYWQPQVSYFCPRYKVVCIDLPGFGQSGKNRNDWSFDNYAADVKAVIDQLQLKNVVLIGHSMCGDLILNVSNKYPGLLLGIVGIDNLHEPSAPPTEERRKQFENYFVKMEKAFDSITNKDMPESLFSPSTPTDIKNRVMNDIFNSDSIIATNVVRANIATGAHEQEMMKALPFKLYLVNGDMFPIKGDSLQKYCAKGYKAEIVKGTGHYPMIEKPEEFNAALQRVVDDMAKK